MTLHDLPPEKGLIVFDSYCVLCSATVSILTRIDRKQNLYFTTFESKVWKDISGETTSEPDSIVFFKKGKSYIQSDAVIMIIATLEYPWRMLNIIRVIPRFLREKLYRLIARNRYKIFGMKDNCGIPSPEIKRRYLI
jgi:predicted DCC family thiol-disulfide oxidoreductase YuxK